MSVAGTTPNITDPKEIIVNVLDIIDYQDDKPKYATEFIDLCEKQALLDALQSLPKEKQADFKQKMSWAKDQDRVKDIIKEYITAEQYTDALKKASQTAFTKFIETLLPELTDGQKDKLQAYLQSIAPLANQAPHA